MRRSALVPFIHADEAGRIQGFWGLSVAPTHHRITVKGRALWTWCAYDSLFIPELLANRAEVESRDPETGELLRLTFAHSRVDAAEPAEIVMSMVSPGAWDMTSAARIRASACHFIYFFASRASAERWQVKHPHTVVLSLDNAFSLGRRHNAHLFGAELARRRGDLS